MSTLTSWVRDLPSNTTPERALMDIEYVWLNDRPTLRDRVNTSSAQAIVDIENAVHEARTPRLAGSLGRGLVAATHMVSALLVSLSLAMLAVPGLIEMVAFEHAALIALAAALVCLVLAAAQPTILRRTGDRFERSDDVMGFLALLTGIAAMTVASRAIVTTPSQLDFYLPIGAAILGAAVVQGWAAWQGYRVRLAIAAGRAPAREQLSAPRLATRRIERAVRAGERRQRSLFAPLRDDERRVLVAEYDKALSELGRRRILSDDEVSIARASAPGVARMRVAADRAHRGVLALGTKPR